MLKRLGASYFYPTTLRWNAPRLFGPPESGGLIGLCPTQELTARKTTKFCKLNNSYVAYTQHNCCFFDYTLFLLLLFNKIKHTYTLV